MDGNRCTDRTAGEQGARERDDSMEEKADSGTISRMGVQMNKSQSHEPLGNLRDDGADGVVVAVVVLDIRASPASQQSIKKKNSPVVVKTEKGAAPVAPVTPTKAAAPVA